VLLHFPLQRTLDGVFAVEDGGNAGDLLVVQLPGLAQRIDAGLGAQLQRRRRADADDVAQGNVGRFVVGEIDTQNTRHGGVCSLSALALLVARVAADDQQLPVPADQLAVFADPLHTRSNLHVRQTPSRGDARYAWKRLFITAPRRRGKRAARNSLARRFRADRDSTRILRRGPPPPPRRSRNRVAAGHIPRASPPSPFPGPASRSSSSRRRTRPVGRRHGSRRNEPALPATPILRQSGN